VAGLRKMRHRGLPKVDWQFTLAMAAYNLVRLPKLLAQPAARSWLAHKSRPRIALSYRVRHMADNDTGYTYRVGPESHPGGVYEIELGIEKIERPAWDLL
jgi:hypothetical protein